MEKIIYYFSGTGNSYRTALKIAEKIGGAKLVSVRCNAKSVSAHNADVIGFVCPVYEWDIPGTMKDFVEKLEVNPAAYIFMIVTYIAIHGKAFETMANILSTKKACLNYGYALHCVASQCTAYPPFPPEKFMIPYMERIIGRISREISVKKSRTYPPMAWLTRKLYPKLMTPYMKIEHEYDKGFYTDKRCVGCEICAKVCPTQNISLKDNRPVCQKHGSGIIIRLSVPPI